MIFDKGKKFDSKKFRDFCEELGIEQQFISVRYPQTNGATEVTNRTILQASRKRLDELKRKWLDKLPNVLWSYMTTPRRATGETPFNLCLRVDAMNPLEIKISHYKTSFSIKNEMTS